MDEKEIKTLFQALARIERKLDEAEKLQKATLSKAKNAVDLLELMDSGS